MWITEPEPTGLRLFLVRLALAAGLVAWAALLLALVLVCCGVAAAWVL